jgi:hypothetical protein
VATITEQELGRIVEGIVEDRGIIIRHNPLGSEEEILMWMLLSCLVSYLSLTEQDTPCFTGRTDAETYRQAIAFVLRGRKEPDFDHGPLLDKLRTV